MNLWEKILSLSGLDECVSIKDHLCNATGSGDCISVVEVLNASLNTQTSVLEASFVVGDGFIPEARFELNKELNAAFLETEEMGAVFNEDSTMEAKFIKACEN